MDAASPDSGLRAAADEQGLRSSTTLGEATKRPHEGAVLFPGGEANLQRTMLSGQGNQFPCHPFFPRGWKDATPAPLTYDDFAVSSSQFAPAVRITEIDFSGITHDFRNR